ncbi:MAG TPA: hypothetical protein VKT75_08860 [Acidobacteriaceae bacterium]|nr:hypothetical protein [Acidobacteriaceae bacterium]
MREWQLFLFACAVFVVSGVCGCRSAWVQATVVNNENAPVNVVEVTYPGGTFGVQSIAAHGSFRYPFHILANDVIRIDFNDATGHSHTEKGPALRQGDGGTLRIEIEPDGKVVWTPQLTSKK